MAFSEEWKEQWKPQQAQRTKISAPVDGLAGRVGNWLRTRTERERHLRVVETLPLGQRRSVALLECDGQRFLAGMGADGVTTLVPLAMQSTASQTEAR